MLRDSVEDIQQAAEKQAARLLHRRVGTAHILLAVLQLEESPGTEALWSLGVDIGRVRAGFAKAFASESRRGGPGKARLTPRARNILKRAAAAAADSAMAPSVSILTDLCTERTGMATTLLQLLGVTPQALREALVRVNDPDSR